MVQTAPLKHGSAMTTDPDLLRIINDTLSAAGTAFSQGHLPRTADSPDIWEISRLLREAMDTHPEFAGPASRFFLGKQLAFFNQHQAVNLLRVALTRGPDGALAWYRTIRAVRRTPMRVVGEVYGLLVQEPYRFSNGVTLMPVSALPDSPNSAMLKQRAFFGMHMDFPAAVMFEVSDVEGEDGHDGGHARFQEITATLRWTIDAFVLADDVAPTVSVVWQEFADPEFHPAEFGRIWMGSQHEGRLPNHPIQVTPEMTEWVERYLTLHENVANACRVPIQRLNLARRRFAPGDKAIDGSVCLEALLSGNARGELTHRLSVRTALLLGRTLEDRIAIAERVRKFYSLRSDVVHGSAPKKEAANRQVTEDGLALCVSVLRAVVMSGEVPKPEEWELSGGPPWNLFSPAATQD
nr:HEPN domain-containing protein [Ancylobacter tetraedralis]